MSERRITRRRGEAIRIRGPATIRVNRRVTLTIEAPRADPIDRLDAPEAPQKDRSGEPRRSTTRDRSNATSDQSRSKAPGD